MSVCTHCLLKLVCWGFFFFFLILQEKKVQLKKAQKDEKAVVSGRLYSFPFQQTNWLKPRGETAFFKC